MPVALASTIAFIVAAPQWAAAFVFALSEKVELTLITSGFGFLTTTVAAVLTYLTRRDVKRGHVEARSDRKRIEAKVDAPRRISTDREAGVRIEGPEKPQ